jgi:SAM-dependent methyltransferase
MLLGVAARVARCIGVDASSAMLEKARENLEAAGLDADLRQGEMEDLPVEAASVDVVLANMALHHSRSPGGAVAEMARVLRPGGRVVLTDLARHGHDWTRAELADEWPGFTPAELAGWMTAARLEGGAVKTVGTCTLTRPGTKKGHAVDVLMATAGAGIHAHSRASRASKPKPTKITRRKP